MRRLKVLAVRTDKSACWFYRVELPLAAMVQAGHEVRVISGTLPMVASDRFDHSLSDWADVVVFQRLGVWRHSGGGVVNLPVALRRLAKRVAVVQDNDDHLAAIDRWNPAGTVWDREQVDAHYATLEAVSLNTVSTAKLERAMRDEMVRRRLMPPPFRVLPNCLPRPTGNYPAKSRMFTVLLSGSKSHVGDWLMVVDELAQWLDGKPDARLMCIGVGVDTLVDWCREAVELQMALERIPRVVCYEWLEYRMYMQAFARAHVLVAPLKDTAFNRCKSDVKAKEAALARVYGVYSPVGEYAEWLRRYEGAGICSPLVVGELGGLLDELYGRWRCGDQVVNEREADRVASEWEISRHVDRWVSAYTQAKLCG